jgi:hypothetical protein
MLEMQIRMRYFDSGAIYRQSFQRYSPCSHVLEYVWVVRIAIIPASSTPEGRVHTARNKFRGQPNVAALLILQAQSSHSLIVAVTLPSVGSSCTA